MSLTVLFSLTVLSPSPSPSVSLGTGATLDRAVSRSVAVAVTRCLWATTLVLDITPKWKQHMWEALLLWLGLLAWLFSVSPFRVVGQ